MTDRENEQSQRDRLNPDATGSGDQGTVNNREGLAGRDPEEELANNASNKPSADESENGSNASDDSSSSGSQNGSSDNSDNA